MPSFPGGRGTLPSRDRRPGRIATAGAGRRAHPPRVMPRLARPIPPTRRAPQPFPLWDDARVGEGVRYERLGAAAVLTIDRPERRNAVDAATARALREGLARFEADDDARVMVLTEAGGEAFCAGADLKAMDLDVDDPAGPMGFSRLAASKPTIAAIDGG